MHAARKRADDRCMAAVIETIELRSALEVEAAGLAAERRDAAQAAAILDAADLMDALILRGGPTSGADRALHLAIADASSNPTFRELLETLGPRLIPREALRVQGDGPTPPDYLREIQKEHRCIADAIVAGDAAAARDAMRRHLIGSRDRYRRGSGLD